MRTEGNTLHLTGPEFWQCKEEWGAYALRIAQYFNRPVLKERRTTLFPTSQAGMDMFHKALKEEAQRNGITFNEKR